MVRRVAAVVAKRVSAEEAAGLVESGMWLDCGAGLCQPDEFERALAARCGGLRAVKIRSCLSVGRGPLSKRTLTASTSSGSVCTSFICLASTYDKGGVRRSRIVLDLTPGNIATTPRTDVMYVVTEYGTVNRRRKSVAERASALISIAHPDLRADLERQAEEQRLIPRGLFPVPISASARRSIGNGAGSSRHVMSGRE